MALTGRGTGTVVSCAPTPSKPCALVEGSVLYPQAHTVPSLLTARLCAPPTPMSGVVKGPLKEYVADTVTLDAKPSLTALALSVKLPRTTVPPEGIVGSVPLGSLPEIE